MHTRTVWTFPVPLTFVLLGGCQAQGDDVFRAYTTNTTLGDGGPTCEAEPPPIAVDPRRSLFETNEVALSELTFEDVGWFMATNGGGVSPPWRLGSAYGHFTDHACPGYVPPIPVLGAGSDIIDLPGINGYPILCERYESTALWGWHTIAAVNRFDLAPADGSNCGEVRIIFGTSGQNDRIGFSAFRRMSIIVEAQVPNPAPECGIQACRPVQEFWASLSAIDDPAVRASELGMAFLTGHPDLEAAGFGPFVDWHNVTFGTGQVRANAAHTPPRTLREFKLVPTDNGAGTIFLAGVEVPVSANPFGELWNDIPHPHSQTCQDAIVASVPLLMADDPNRLGIELPTVCLAGESPDLPLQDYAVQLVAGGQGPGSLYARIADEIVAVDPTSTLTPEHIAHRASLLGCIGCHGRLGPGSSLGEGMTTFAMAPFALLPRTEWTEYQANPVPAPGTGQHVSETVLTDCGDGTECFAISPALEQSFLPFRQQVMEAFLANTACCTSEEPQCCAPAPGEPVCDPEVQLCDPVDLDPTVECDPTAEGCGPEAEGPGLDPPDPTMEMHDDARGPGMLATETTPRFEDFDLDRFIALERRLRLEQSPRTISGRPNVGGH